MNRIGWLSRGADRLQLNVMPSDVATAMRPLPAAPIASAEAPLRAAAAGGRPIRERLLATLRQQPEALSPRALRRTLTALSRVAFYGGLPVWLVVRLFAG